MRSILITRRWQRRFFRMALAMLQVMVITGFYPRPAAAQYNWDYAWGYSYNSRYFATKKRRSGTGKSLPRGTRKPVRDAPHRSTVTTFTPIGDRNYRLWSRASDITEKVNWGTDSPSAAYDRRQQAIEKIKVELARHLDTFAKQAKAEGKSPHDVAYGIGRSIAINYAVATGKPVTTAQQTALVAQSRVNLLADPQFRDMDDEQRQNLYENAVAPSMMARTSGSRELARKNLKALVGVPAERIQLTSKGMVIKP